MRYSSLIDDSLTNFNYKRPDFISGLSRVLDLGLTYSNHEIDLYDPDQSDYEAILSDWQMTGDDLKKAIRNFNHFKSNLKESE